MSAVYKNIVIEWKDEKVSIKPTFELINSIEDKVNLALMAQRLNSRDIRFSHVATLFAELLKAGGERVTGNDVYGAMFSGKEGDEGTISAAIQAVNLALEAFYPQSESQADLKKSQK